MSGSLPVSGAYARYQAANYNPSNNIWTDSTGNNRTIPSKQIINTGLSLVQMPSGFFGSTSSFTCLQGTTASTIQFTMSPLPQYTLFHVARYTGGSNKRIFGSPTNNWFSGFYNGNNSVANHENWITSITNVATNNNWLLSSDTQYLYKANGSNMTTVQNTGNAYMPPLTVNLNSYQENSTFQIVDVIIYNSYLTAAQISTVESYLANLYGLSASLINMSVSVGNNAGLPVPGAFSRFQASNYDTSNNVWIDSTGTGNSIPSSQITKTGLSIIQTPAGFNACSNSFTALQGTTNSTIQYTTGQLPQYTLFHVARYTDVSNGAIFTSSTTNWLSGFQGGYNSVACHEGWLTNSSNLSTNQSWLLSSDTQNLYKANGVNVTTSSAGDSFMPILTTNISSNWTTSAFQIADIIIYNSYLTPAQISTVENYLANLYGLVTSLKNIGVTVGTSAGLPVAGVYSRFNASSYDLSNNVWTDLTGLCNSIPSSQITNTGLSFVQNPAGFNGINVPFTALQGTTASQIKITTGPISQYTLFHVARYTGVTNKQIFTSKTNNWFSGFYNGYNSVAYHESFLTNTTINSTTNWIISADTQYLYRANGVNQTISASGTNYLPALSINNNSTADYSTFQIVDIIIYNSYLTSAQIASVETYLANLYGITSALTNMNVSVGNNAGLPISGAFARFQASKYDISNNIWIDSTGLCNSIPSSQITNTGLSLVQSPSGFNGSSSSFPVLQGTGVSTIQYTTGRIPQYTLFHVARYTDVSNGAIFTSNTTNWLSGFQGGYNSVACHEGWLTNSSNLSTNKNWLLSSDTQNLYKANGINVTTSATGDNFLPTLTTNISSYYTASAFQIVDVIIYNSYLTPVQIITVENYLANLYGLTTSLTNTGVSVGTNAGLPIPSAFARYQASNYDLSNNIWTDSTGQCNSISSSQITNTGLSLVQTTANTNGSTTTFTALQGTTASKIQITKGPISQYTLFHVARFTGTSTGSIITSSTNNWLSGFYGGYPQIAYHEGWLTNSSGTTSTDWLLSADTQNLYKANGINVTTSATGSAYLPNLSINNSTSQNASNFQIVDIIIYSNYLTTVQIANIENYLANLYGLTTSINNLYYTPTNYTSLPVSGAYARYQASNYNSSTNTWGDSTGNSRTIPSSQITSTGISVVQSPLGFYGTDLSFIALQGTTSSKIQFTTATLTQYTLFHVARFTSASTGSIITSNTLNWSSGFYNGINQVAYHNAWVTNTTNSGSNNNWILSSDTQYLYRSNGVNMTPVINIGTTYLPTLSINSSTTQSTSNFQIVDIIIYNTYLTPVQIASVENYLANIYGLTSTLSTIGISVETSTGLPVSGAYARFKSSDYDISNNWWIDSTGMGNSIPSSQITKTGLSLIQSSTGYNGSNASFTCLQGTTASTIQMTIGNIPQYTLFHIARFTGTTNQRIITSTSTYNWASGFYNGNSQTAYHDALITDATNASGNTDWLLSSDTKYTYRANGVDLTKIGIGDTFIPGFGVNLYDTASRSTFQIVDVIIYNTYLTTNQIASIESYLANLYGLTNTMKNMGITVGTNADLPVAGAFARFKSTDYDISNNRWIDSTGMSNSIPSSKIINTGLSFVQNASGYLGSNTNITALQGTTSSQIQFTSGYMQQYTLFHVARYNNVSNGSIFSSNTDQWLSGYYSGNSQIALHGGSWITNTTNIYTNPNWNISTDSKYLFKVNATNVTTSLIGITYMPSLWINNSSWYGTSSFQVVDIIIYNSYLTPSQITTVETYLANLYGIIPAKLNLGISVGNNAGLPISGAYARFKSTDFDLSNNVWIDSTGLCNSIPSSQITKTGLSLVQTPAGYFGSNNTFTSLQGTTSSQIQMTTGKIQNYTLFHVARFNGVSNGSIFSNNTEQWISGFYNGNSQTALHNGLFITKSTFGASLNWQLSTDTKYLFKGNGVDITTAAVGTTYLPNLWINNSPWYGTSSFQIVDVIIYNSYLTTSQILTVESYLANLYGLVPSLINMGVSIGNNAGLPIPGAYARFKATDYDLSNNLWIDSTGLSNSIPSSQINKTGLSFVQNPSRFYGTNVSFSCLQGTTSSQIQMTSGNMQQYTLFHVARYNNVSNGSIFSSNTDQWLSGFYNGSNQIAMHGGVWITNSSNSYTNNKWILSTDTKFLYKANSVNLTTVFNTGITYMPSLWINNSSWYGTSSFQIVDVIVYNSYLTASQITTVENYLTNLYGLTTSLTNNGISVGNNANLPVPGAYARFKSTDFDLSNNLWIDSTGMSNSIPSSQITNTGLSIMQNTAGYLGTDVSFSCLQGTSSSQIQMTVGNIQQYTLFHVARYNNVSNKCIFGSNTNQWFSGFYNGMSQVALHDGTWITNSVGSANTNWLLSTDSQYLYRADAKNITIYPAGNTFMPPLWINNSPWYGISSFQIADVIIYNSYLTQSQIATVESYLANLYGMKLSQRNLNLVTYTTNLPVQGVYARFKATDYDPSNNIWIDSTGLCNSVPSSQISNTGLSVVANNSGFNGSISTFTCIQGTPSSQIQLLGYLPKYTLFHVARYTTGTNNVIFTSKDYGTWYSGFYAGTTYNAYHGSQITQNNGFSTQNWILSTDTQYSYRGDGTNLTNTITTGINYLPSLSINSAQNGTSGSNFQIVDIIIYDSYLTPAQILLVETYLSNIYGLTTAITNMGISIGTNASLPIPGAYARFQATNYNPTTNNWIDSTGMGNSIPSSFITNTSLSLQTTQPGYFGSSNSFTCLQGTPSSSIQITNTTFSKYTLFNVARFYDSTNSPGAIVSSSTMQWGSGFYTGYSSVANHNGFITNTNPSNMNWLLSSDTQYIYRANGKNFTTVSSTYTSMPPLGINKSSYNTNSSFQIVDIIIYNSYLTQQQITTIETYLANLYGLSLSMSNMGITVGTNSGLPVPGAYARFKATDYNISNNIWIDSTGMSNSIPSSQINNTDLSFVNSLPGYNGTNTMFTSLQGSVNSKIQFTNGIIQNYTLFHVARYTNLLNNSVILTSTNSQWYSGFYNNNVSVANHNAALNTTYNKIVSNTNWLLSSDTINQYKGNGKNDTISINGGYSYLPILAITNNSWYSTSAFQIVDIIIYNSYLTQQQITTVETYLANLYGLTLSMSNMGVSIGTNSGLPVPGAYSRFKISDYDISKNIWIDSTGMCNSIPSSLIQNTGLSVISNKAGFNTSSLAFPCIEGNSNTYVTFSGYLPQYTIFHIGRYTTNNNSGVIFSSYNNASWISGFYNGYISVANHSTGYLTQTNNSSTNWLLSSDTKYLYRGNGINSTINSNTGVTYLPSFALINGWWGLTNGFQIADVIIYNSYLTINQIMIVENYLATLYGLTTALKNNYLTNPLQTVANPIQINQNSRIIGNGVSSLVMNSSFNTLNGIGMKTSTLPISGAYARYQALNYDVSNNVWYDSTGNGRTIPSSQINNNGITMVQTTNGFYGLNNGSNIPLTCLQGTMSSSIQFTTQTLTQYTLFHVARYTGIGGSSNRIFTSNNANWFSGFWNNSTGIAFHDSWLTDTNVNSNTDWLLSSDTKYLYKANGINMTINANAGDTFLPNLCVNLFTKGQQSSFQILDVIIYNSYLTSQQIATTETYLASLYGLTTALSATGSYSIGSPVLFESLLDVSNNIYTELVNGNTEYTFVSNGTNIGSYFMDSSNQSLYICNRSDNASWVSQNICEILIYNTPISTSYRQQVEGFLAWKWNINSQLPTGHPYYSAPPANPF